MKKKIFLILSFLCVFSFVLFGCDSIQMTLNPNSTDTIYGNGSFAVVKGDYLYFANSYLSFEELGVNDNKYDKDSPQKNYGIFRTKLNNVGMIEIDEDGFPIGAELLVPQVAGYEYSGLYIYGDYLYYSTPFSGENRDGESVKGLVRFERVKIDGTDHKILYSTTSYSSDCSYKIGRIDDVIYITIFQSSDSNSALEVVKIKNGFADEYQIDSSIATYASFEEKDIAYGTTTNDFNKYVYYTKNTDSRYSLYRKLLDNSAPAQLLVAPTTTKIEIQEIKNNRLYYKFGDVLKSSSFALNEIEKTYSYGAISDSTSGTIVSFLTLEDTKGYAVDRGILAVFYDGTNYILSIYNGLNSVNFLKSWTKQITLLYVESDYVYYQIADDENVYCLNIQTKAEVIVSSSINLTVGEDSTNKFIDFDGERIFYFAKVENSNKNYYYLHMIKVPNGYKNSNNEPCGQFVGVLESSDVVAE